MVTPSETPPEKSSAGAPIIVRDKRRLGLLLVTISSLASLAIVGFFVVQIVFSLLDDQIAKEANDLENFPTAAGSEKPGGTQKK